MLNKHTGKICPDVIMLPVEPGRAFLSWEFFHESPQESSHFSAAHYDFYSWLDKNKLLITIQCLDQADPDFLLQYEIGRQKDGSLFLSIPWQNHAYYAEIYMVTKEGERNLLGRSNTLGMISRENPAMQQRLINQVNAMFDSSKSPAKQWVSLVDRPSQITAECEKKFFADLPSSDSFTNKE